MKMLNRVLQKIENDYQEFKASMLAEDVTAVFERAYKIFCIRDIYDDSRWDPMEFYTSKGVK